MKINKKILKKEIKTLQKAAKLHAKYSIKQYKEVLKALEELEYEKKILEEKVKERTFYLEKLAKFDTLTGLPNRHMFKEELSLTYKSSKLLKKPFTLLFIDLDNFKYVNDVYGHEAGDILLQTIAKRFSNVIRKESDIVSRLGGDEFTIILKGIYQKENIEKIVKKLIETANKPISINERVKVNVSASIGIYIFNFTDTIEQIIANADIAMYKAKELGKNRFVFYNSSMKKEVSNKLTLKQELLKAFKNKEFINYLQPVVNSKTQQIVGAEVLLRWYNDGKIITPQYFLPTLEEMDLIIDITYYQIEEIIKEFQNYNNLFLSFNLGPKLLNNKFITYIKKLKHKNIPKLSFEITENDLISNIRQAKDILFHVSSLKYNILLDDFGTGYSSLAYIKELPLDTIKIDKVFVKKITSSIKDYKLFKSIIEMAKILEMKVVVEGVEKEEELKLIDKEEFIKIQGYYFYKPMNTEQFKQLIS